MGMYFVLNDSLRKMEAGLYEYGTFVFALTLKVCFLHHQWNYINVLGVVISLGGALAAFMGLSLDSFLTYYLDNSAYNGVADWFYAIFTVPLMCVFIDIIFYQLHLNFFPSNEMIFLDSEYEEKQREKKGESLSQEDADV